MRPLPENWQRFIQDLSKKTVEHGWDPATIIGMLLRTIEFKQNVWPKLTEEQRQGVMDELRRRARKPVRFRYGTTRLEERELPGD